MASGTSSNHEDKWRSLVQWSADSGAERKPEFDDTNQKIEMYGFYDFLNFPRSSASATAWITLVDGVHSSMDGKYFMLQWDGTLPAPTGVWALLNDSREFYLRPPGSEVEPFIMTIEPNFTDTGWNQIEFDNISLPASFNYSPTEGTVHIDWMRGVTNWSSASISYEKYDILGHPYSTKGDLVGYDFKYYACLQDHVSSGASTPFLGSAFWERIRQTI